MRQSSFAMSIEPSLPVWTGARSTSKRPRGTTAGEGARHDERQLVQLANAAWAAGFACSWTETERARREWLVRAAARYRESWQEGVRVVGPADRGDEGAAHRRRGRRAARREWALDAGAADAESPIGRYAGTLALLVLGRDTEAAEVAATLDDPFPADVAAALRALAPATAVRSPRRSPTSGGRTRTATATSKTFRSPTRPWRWKPLTRGVGSRREARAPGFAGRGRRAGGDASGSGRAGAAITVPNSAFLDSAGRPARGRAVRVDEVEVLRRGQSS